MNGLQLHPLAAGTPGHLWRTARELGPIARASQPTWALTTFFAGLLAPFRWTEALRFGARLRATTITEPPLFILGFWRSGTTFLHQLLAHDPALAAPETVHLVFPSCSLASGLFRRILAAELPAERVLDGTPQGPDLPEEEEIALAHLGASGLDLGIYFPQRLRQVFARAVALEHPADRAAFQRDYLRILRKLTFIHPGRRLVLKNPPNSGRIPVLLELFPAARFIFLARDRTATLASATRWLKEQHQKALQPISEAQAHADLDFLYQELRAREARDRSLIPREHQVDLDFKLLTTAPMAAIEQVYAGLGLPLSQRARDAMNHYLAQRAAARTSN